MTLLAGRYELGERLGLGGMSTVVVAFDRRLERDVAVKLLAEHLADDAAFVTRFRREALAAARLVHPNVVQVFDFGFDEPSHRHFIVMEVVRGPSGAELLRERGRLPLEEAVSMVAQACRGLDYAHRNGVVHRDVKPGNLLRAEDGTVKLADFGIARTLSEESSITQVGSVLGTAAYLAPEQAAGHEAGPAADVYATGVVTYQLISGRLPYEAQSLTELALKQQRDVPARLDELDPLVPPALASAVARALALEPRERWSSAEELRVALEDGARGIGDVTEPTRAVGGDPTLATRAVEARPAPESVAPRRPRQPRPAPVAPPSREAPSAPQRRQRVAASAPAPPPRRRRAGRLRRALVRTLALLALLAVAAAVVVSTVGRDAVQLRDTVRDTVDETVTELQQLIEDNTRRGG